MCLLKLALFVFKGLWGLFFFLNLSSGYLNAYFTASSPCGTLIDLGPLKILKWRLVAFAQASLDKPQQEEVELTLVLTHQESDRKYRQMSLDVSFIERRTNSLLASHSYTCQLGKWPAGKKKTLLLRLRPWENPSLGKQLAWLQPKDVCVNFTLTNLKEWEAKP